MSPSSGSPSNVQWPRVRAGTPVVVKRGAIVAGVVALMATAAHADGETVAELRVHPGVGFGLPLGLSLELNFEGRHWYAGAQLAIANNLTSNSAMAFAGGRAGWFVSDGSSSLFIGVGAGRLSV